MRDFLIFIGVLLVCISAAGGGYKLGHAGGYQQGMFEARIECQRAHADDLLGAVNQAIRAGVDLAIDKADR